MFPDAVRISRHREAYRTDSQQLIVTWETGGRVMCAVGLQVQGKQAEGCTLVPTRRRQARALLGPGAAVCLRAGFGADDHDRRNRRGRSRVLLPKRISGS
ncbi:hypothetical protein Deide_07474 [Deinococcus deserti VCD115]|uniref:Uncharacterized protein n=1 Tax=Deinococcus deserti (strain DSM 17065 / CIP 109153 / LMG 22923 / VCD115) TaxID=546414 RepID=X5H5E4_DEIDV|nr:hypothetical protein Deide_07474 [Deinococcus deserti VCD115]